MLKWIKDRKSRKHSSRSRSKGQLDYQSLEPRQLLAVSAALSSGEFTLTGDVSANDFYLRVDAGTGNLQWSEDGFNYTDDLDSSTSTSETHTLSPADPLSVKIETKGGNDSIELDMGGTEGLKNVTVDGGANIDSIVVKSDLDLLETGGKLDINVEDISVQTGVLVAAPKGIHIESPVNRGFIELGEHVMLSSRAISPGGDHYVDVSVDDSEKIVLQSKEIRIGDHTSILAHVEPGSIHTAGDVSIKATEKQANLFELYDLLTNLQNNNVPWTEAFDFFDQQAIATIDIGTVDIFGKAIEIKAVAGGTSVIPTIGQIIDAVGNDKIEFLETVADFLSPLLPQFSTPLQMLPTFWIKETSTATIRIGQNADLDASAAILISAESTSEEKVKVASTLQAIAVITVDSTSEIKIEEGVNIDAENSVDIKTKVKIKGEANASTKKNLAKGADKERLSLAVAIANTNLKSTIALAESSNVVAGTDVRIHAKGNQTINSHATSGIYKDGGIGVVTSFSFPTAEVTAEVDGSIMAHVGTPGADEGGIEVWAELTTDETSYAVSGLGGDAPKIKYKGLQAVVKDFVKNKIVPIVKKLGLENLINGTEVVLDVSTSLALTKSNNDVLARVGGSAQLGSNMDIHVKSDLESEFRTFSESAIDHHPSDTDETDMVSVAVTVGLYDNHSTATLEDGVTVDAKRKLTVEALTEYPFKFPVKIVKKGDIRTLEIKGNSWARSHSLGGKSQVAGSLNYQDYNTATQATIGANANINQDLMFTDIDQDVEVKADTKFKIIDIAGIFQLEVKISELTSLDLAVWKPSVNIWQDLKAAFKADWNQSDIGYGMGAKNTAVGGALSIINIHDDTVASIGENSFVTAGMDGAVKVKANSDLKHYTFSVAGLEAEKVGIQGSLAHTRQVSNTTAKIGQGANIVAGDISVTANSDVTNISFAGGAIHGANIGFGISAATHDVTRNALAYIGFPGKPMWSSSLFTPGKLDVTATTSGGFVGIALSGVYPGKTTQPVSPPSTNQQGDYGVGFSADVAINRVDSHVQAFINDSGDFQLGSLKINASDDTPLIAIAGAAAINGEEDSTGFAGSYTHNILTGSALAWLQQAELGSMLGSVDVAAKRLDGSKLISMNASAAGKGKYVVAGNVALNDSTWITQSALHNVDIINAKTATISSSDQSKIWAIAGGVQWNGKLGFSTSFSMNQIDSVTSTLIENSLIELTENLTAKALAESTIHSISAGFGNGEKLSIAGTVALNEIDSTVSTVATGLQLDSGAGALLDASDKSEILAISGAATAFKGCGFAGSYSGNTIEQTVESTVDQSNLEVADRLAVQASANGRIRSLAAGVAIQDKFSLAGSVSDNDIESRVDAHVTESLISAGKDVEVAADATGQIGALAGNFAGVGQAAVGASVSLNHHQNHVTAFIENSAVQSIDGSVDVSGQNDSEIKSLAVSGAGAQSFALGGSVGHNTIESDVDVHVTSSTVDAASDLNVTAENEGVISSLTGGIAAASTAAIGAAVGLNDIESSVRACIVDSVVDVGQDVQVLAENDAVIKTIAIGGAGAGTFALGGSVAVNQVDSTTRSCIMKDSDITAGGSITVKADDQSTIQAIAPGVAGSGTVAVGIAVVDNDVMRNVKAIVSDTTMDAADGVFVQTRSVSQQNTIGIGGSFGTTVGVAGSSVSNRLSQKAVSAIDDSDTSVVNTAGNVYVTSHVENSVDSLVISGAGSASFALAGSVATVHLDLENWARIGDGVVVNADRNVLVEAIDTTHIDSLTGTAAVGAAVAGAGASVSTIQLHKNVFAEIGEGAEVYAATASEETDEIEVYSGEQASATTFQQEPIRGVGVQATSNEMISNLAATGAAGTSAGVAGSVTVEMVSPHVEAWIGKNAIVDANSAGIPAHPGGANGEKGNTNVNVSAVDNLQIDSTDGVGGVGVAGIAGSVDVGKVDYLVWGHIDADATVSAMHDIDVHGLSNKVVDSQVGSVGGGLVGLQGAVTVWNIGTPFDSEYWVGGVKSNSLTSGNTTVDQFASDSAAITNQRRDDILGQEPGKTKSLRDDLHSASGPSGVIATVKQGATLTAGDDVDVRAREWMLIELSAGGLGVGYYAGVGASIALANVHSNTEAGIYGTVSANDHVWIQASLEETTDARAWAGDGGIAGLGAAVSIVNETSEQTARVAHQGNIAKAGILAVDADNWQDIHAQTGQGAIGLAAGGASVAKINASGLTEAYISDSAVGFQFVDGAGFPTDPALATVGNVFVLADSHTSMETDATAINVGVAAGAGTTSKVTADSAVLSWVGQNSDLLVKGDLNVWSDSDLVGKTDALAVTPLAGASFGLSKSQADLRPTVLTFVDQADVSVGDDLVVTATHAAEAMAEGQSVKISVVNGEGLVANALALPSVRTWVGGRETNIVVMDDMQVLSTVSQLADVDARGMTVSLVGAGVVRATSDASGTTLTEIGRGVDMQVGDDLAIESTVSSHAVTEATAPGFGIVNYFGTIAESNASPNSRAILSNVADLTVGGNTLVASSTDRTSASETKALNISLGAAIGTSKSTAMANGKTEALVLGHIAATGDLTVSASDTITTTSRGKSTSAGLLAGSGVKSSTDTSPETNAKIHSAVNASGDVAILASSDLKTQAHGETMSLKAVGLGTTRVEAISNPNTTAALAAGGMVTAGGDLQISAEQALLSAIPNTAMVTGQGGQIALGLGGFGLTLTAEADPTVTSLAHAGASVIAVDDLHLSSEAENRISTEDRSFSVGVLSGGKSRSDALLSGQITSELYGTVGAVDDVSITASTESFAAADSTATSIAGVVGIRGGAAITVVNPWVITTLGSSLAATGDIEVIGSCLADADANTRGVAVNGAVGVGEMSASASVRPILDTTIGERVNATALGDIHVRSRHNVDANGNLLNYGASARSESADVALGFSVHSNTATASSRPTVKARALNSATLTAGQEISVTADSFNDSHAEVDGLVLGLVTSFGNVTANASSTGTTEAALDRIRSANAREGQLEVMATDRSDANADATGTAGGILAGFNGVKATAASSADVAASVQAQQKVQAKQDVQIVARASGDIDVKAVEKSASVGFNQGSVLAGSVWSPKSVAVVKPFTEVVSNESIRVQSLINHEANGDRDDDRKIQMEADSDGGALFTGRSAKSDARIEPEAWSQVEQGAVLTASSDLLISARSHNYLDAKSNTKLIGFAGISFAKTTANARISTRAEILDNMTPAVLSAGGDIDIDSYTNWEAIAFARAKAKTPLAIRKADAIINTNQLDTVSLVGMNNHLTAGNDIKLWAEKISENSIATAQVVLGFSNAEINNNSLHTKSDTHSSSTITAGNSSTATWHAADPIHSKARAVIQDDRKVSDQDYQTLVAGGHIGAHAAISTQADIYAGFDPGAKVTAGKKTRVISELRHLKMDAQAKFQTKRNTDNLLSEVESLDLTVRADLPGVDSIEKRFTEEPSRGLRYKAKITSGRNGFRPPQTIRGSDTKSNDPADLRLAAINAADQPLQRRSGDVSRERDRQLNSLNESNRLPTALDVVTGDRDREFASIFDSYHDENPFISESAEGLELTDELFSGELTDVDDDFLLTGI